MMMKHRRRRIQYGGAPANPEIPINSESGGPGEDQQLNEMIAEIRANPKCQLPTTYQYQMPLYPLPPYRESGKLSKFSLRNPA